MKAGDVVYEHESFPKTRGELVEFLCDGIEAALGPDETDRISNGQVADTLLRFLDVAVTTDAQKAALRAFLNGDNEDDG